MTKRWPVIAALLVFMAAAVFGLVRRSPSAAPNPPSVRPVASERETARYAGSASCAACHAQAYHDWQDSHHALAQRTLSPKRDEAAFVPPRAVRVGEQTSTVELSEGRFVLSTALSGGPPCDYELAEMIGVSPLWQGLVPQPGGRLQATALAHDPAARAWFSVQGMEDRQPWEWGHWSNRGMNWNSMCAYCHTTAFNKNYDAERDAYGSTYQERGVGCEQCHGPMQAHVEWQAKNPAADHDPTISRLNDEQFLAVCGSCHSRRADLTGQFRPGDAFTDHFEPILPDATDTFYADGQVREEDFEFVPFMLSYMHGQGVRCTNCHSPHSGKLVLEGNALCLQCHREGVTDKIAIEPLAHGHHPVGGPGSYCVDCHMPVTTYMQRHPRHDHGMTIPDPLLTQEHGIPNACNRCHAERTVDWALEQVEAWYGRRMQRPTRERARLLARAKKGDRDAVPDLLTLLKQEKNPTWRAVCARMLIPVLDRNPGRSFTDALTRALEPLLNDASPLAQVAAINTLAPLAAHPSESLTAKLIEKLQSPHRLVRIKAAWVLRQSLDMESPAGRELAAFLRYNQDQPLGAFQWGNFYSDTDRRQAALPWYEKSMRWDPGAALFGQAYAVALVRLGRPSDAVAPLLRARELAPQESLYPYSLGLVYAELGRAAEARDALRAAVSLDSSQGRYWYNLALAELKLNNTDACVEGLAKAEQLEPEVADYPYTRATVYYRLRQYDQARAAAQQALRIDPNHPLALTLLRALGPED